MTKNAKDTVKQVKEGEVNLFMTNIDIVDIPIVMGKMEEFVKSLRNSGMVSSFDDFFINSEMKHMSGEFANQDKEDHGGAC